MTKNWNGEDNIVMNKNILIFKTNITERAKVKQFEGQDHLVVPVVAAKEAVMNDYLYPERELKKNIKSWNGVPITINHPNESGEDVSVNSPMMMEMFSVGKFFNVKYDGGVKGEIWLNVKQAEEKGFDEIISNLKDGVMMEVSTGLMSDLEHKSGVFKNKRYDGVIKGIIPDHLAILPNDLGACSIDDGCGTHRTHKANCDCSDRSNVDKYDGKKPGGRKGGKNKIKEAFNYLKDALFKTNELGHDDIRAQIRTILEDELGPDVFFVIEEVFDDFFVCEKFGKLFKRSYTVSNDVVSLGDDAIEVVRQTSFIEVGEEFKINKEDAVDSKEKLVGEILTNKGLSDEKSVKDTLLKLDEKVLNKLMINDEQKDEKPDNEQKDEIPTDDEQKEESVDDVLGNIKNPEVKEVITNAVVQERKRKEDLISGVMDNSELKKEELKGMNVSVLEKLFNSLKPTVYVGRGGSAVEGNGHLPPAPPAVLANLGKEIK